MSNNPFLNTPGVAIKGPASTGKTKTLQRVIMGAAANQRRVLVLDGDRDHADLVYGMGGEIVGLTERRSRQPSSGYEYLLIDLQDWVARAVAVGNDQSRLALVRELERFEPDQNTVVVFDAVECIEGYGEANGQLAWALHILLNQWIDDGVPVVMAARSAHGPLAETMSRLLHEPVGVEF